MSSAGATSTPASTTSGTSEVVAQASAHGTTRVLIKARNTAAVAAQAGALGAKHVRRLTHASTVIAEVTASAAAQLGTSADVVSMAPDRVLHVADTASAQRLEFDAAQAAGKSGAGATVAIIDTGIDSDHPYLAGRVIDEACYSSPQGAGEQSLCPGGVTGQVGAGAAEVDGVPACTFGAQNICDHGTHVAGIAGGDATGAPGSPGNGVAPSVNIVAIQVFTRFPAAFPGGEPGLGAYDSDIALGLDRVAALADAHPEWNLTAANMSLGGDPQSGPCDTDPLKPAIDALLVRNVATVVAAGNEGNKSMVSSPGCISTAVTVGATNFLDQIVAFSNRGAPLDLWAPGLGVRSSVPGGAYATFSGTSMATPQVTGAFAVLRAQSPASSIASLLAKLSATGQPVAFTAKGVKYTRSRVDVMGALVAPGKTVAVGDASVVEGNTGVKRTVYVPVTLSSPPSVATSVRYSVVPGTASSSDVKTFAGTKVLTFKPGATAPQTAMTKYIPVAVTADAIAESDETFSVVLSSPSNGYALGRAAGTGTVIDDDSAPAGPKVSVGDVKVVEGHVGAPRIIRFAVTLSQPAATSVSVAYVLTGGTASSADVDGLGAVRALTIKAGAIKSFVAVAVRPDYRVEGTETFSVTLASPSGGYTLNRAVGTGTILDDDTSPS